MSNAKNNNIFEKTSFLGSNSSKFIEQLYADYLQKPEEVPNEWRDFFNGLKDKKEEIIKTIKGPSWSRKFKDIKISNGLKNVNEKINKTDLNTIGNRWCPFVPLSLSLVMVCQVLKLSLVT